VGSGISVGLAAAGLFTGAKFDAWMIYPGFPGIALNVVAIWFRDVHWGLHPLLAKAVFVAGNAVFYSAACYFMLWLRLMWKR
jgi:hypothetical protein